MKKNIIAALMTVISIFTYSLDIPKVYDEKGMSIEGYEVIKKDINTSDGKTMKMVVYSKKLDSGELDTYFNLYENSDGTYKLALQSEKKLRYSLDFSKSLTTYINSLGPNITKYTKDLAPNEVRKVEFYDEYLPGIFVKALKYDKNTPNFINFLFIKKKTEVKGSPSVMPNTNQI